MDVVVYSTHKFEREYLEKNIVGHSLRLLDMRLTIETPSDYLNDVNLGDSIAINGACMTAVSVDALRNQFAIDISAESLSKTSGLTQQGVINLEKALRAHDRLGSQWPDKRFRLHAAAHHPA